MKRCAECIILDVANAFGVPSTALRGPVRKRHIAYARFAAYHMLKEETKLSYPAIGRILGHRDHSTIIAGYWRADRLRLADPDFAAQYERARG